jgi:hypothetical protein
MSRRARGERGAPGRTGAQRGAPAGGRRVRTGANRCPAPIGTPGAPERCAVGPS